MALTVLRTRNEVRFEFGYIGFATSNDARGDSGHSAFIQNIDRELYQFSTILFRRNGALLKLDQSNVQLRQSLGEIIFVTYFRI